MMRKIVISDFFLFKIFTIFFCIASHAKIYANSTPLAEQSFKEIIERYSFINDFTQKDEPQNISSELFWRYPFKIPDEFFPIIVDIEKIHDAFIATKGGGRVVEHLNAARIQFLKGNDEEAKKILIAARDKYGNTSEFHRRTDLYIGQIFLVMGWKKLQENQGNYANIEVKKYLHQAASFLSLAAIKKADIYEETFDQSGAMIFYNLAAIYYTYKRYAASYGAATEGLNFLRKTGKTEFRSNFRRILAESWIRNRNYLRAAQELDEAIRQDQNKEGVSSAFARIADIYYDLNNYDLAEDAYSLSNAVDRELKVISPRQLILRGESLFWLGKFEQSQKMFQLGLENSYNPQAAPLPEDYASWALLRIADSHLAYRTTLKNEKTNEREDFLKKATLGYFKVESQYPKSEAAKIAKIRRACLELPFYSGKNIEHSRKDLEEYIKLQIAPQAIELAWSCHVGSFAQRERNTQMLDRVRVFANKYPESRFLKDLINPVIETQQLTFEKLVKDNQKHLALSFFEANRNRLFKEIPTSMSSKLFQLYVDINDSTKAEEFWTMFNKNRKSQLDLLRAIVFVSEMYDTTRTQANSENLKWEKILKSLQKETQKIDTLKLEQLPEVKNLFDRIYVTTSSTFFNEWLLKIAESWSSQNIENMCMITLPLYQKLGQQNELSQIRSLKQKVANLIEKNFPNILLNDKLCGINILQLEQNLEKDNLSQLAKKWLIRDKWPPQPEIINLIWGISEEVAKNNDLQTAKNLWNHIIKYAAPDSPEVKLAKMRLDPQKTEFEDLWEN